MGGCTIAPWRQSQHPVTNERRITSGSMAVRGGNAPAERPFLFAADLRILGKYGGWGVITPHTVIWGFG